MGYQVARVGNLVQVGDQIGKIITGNASYYVGEQTGGAGGGGGDDIVALTESVGMETEQMSPTEKRSYIEQRFGSGTADAINRATTPTVENPNPSPVAATPNPAASVPVGCNGLTNDSPDSTQISKYFTVGMLSSQIYQSVNCHTIPASTAKGLTRATVMCNLKYLATNSLDPFQDWLTNNTSYTFKVGSGFRNNTNGSDHNIGSAADLHIFQNGTRISRENLRQLAIKIVNQSKLPYTQLLLEYTGSSSSGWIHFANRQSGRMSALPVAYSLTGSAPYYANFPSSV